MEGLKLEVQIWEDYHDMCWYATCRQYPDLRVNGDSPYIVRNKLMLKIRQTERENFNEIYNNINLDCW